jgi:hypothetical protein
METNKIKQKGKTRGDRKKSRDIEKPFPNLKTKNDWSVG